MPKPYPFGYAFSEENYRGAVRLDWTITAELWTVDKQGNRLQEVDRQELVIGRLDARNEPRIELTPLKHRRGFYRFEMQIADQSGKVLGAYGNYFKVVRPFWRVRLGVTPRTARPGQRVWSRLENFGSESVEFGEEFGIQRLELGHWVSQPDLTSGVWLLWAGWLGPGGTGFCNSIELPKDAPAGSYRFVKHVEPGRHRKQAFLTARFTVTD